MWSESDSPVYRYYGYSKPLLQTDQLYSLATASRIADSLFIICKMATVVAQSHYIFGLRTGVRNNLLYSDEQTVIFPCGNNCVRYNVDQKCQKFIPGRFTTAHIYSKSKKIQITNIIRLSSTVFVVQVQREVRA